MLAAVRQVRAGAMAMVALLVALLVTPLGVGATVTVRDTELNSTVGVFDSREGVFKVKLPAAGLVGWLAVGSPVNGCSPLQPVPTWRLSLLHTWLSSLGQALLTAHQDQWVVLLKRGDCNFVDKLMVAARAGYSAVIVYNNEEDGIVVMKDNSNAPIPAVMVGLAAGLNMTRLVTQTVNNKRYLVLLLGDDIPSFYDYLTWIVLLLVICLTVFVCLMCCYCCLSRYRRVRPSRLPLPALSALPVKQFDAEQHAFDTCAICLDDFKQNDEIRVLPCNHAYHPVCIDPWLTNSSRLCPICKRRVLEDEFSSASSDDDDRRRSSSSSVLVAQRRRRRLHTAASSERDRLLASADQRSRHHHQQHHQQHHHQQQHQQQSAASYGGAATSRNSLEDVNAPSGASSRFVSRFCRCLRRSDLSQHAVSSDPAAGNPPSSPTGSGRATATAAAATSHTAAAAAHHAQRSQEGRSEATSLPSGGSGVIARLHRRRAGGRTRVPVVSVPTEQPPPPPPPAAAAAAAADESDESGDYSRGLAVEVDCDSDTQPLVV